ncbi:MAG: hypothetical protein WBD99_06280 [Thermodesulfobacteriota bacterium]
MALRWLKDRAQILVNPPLQKEEIPGGPIYQIGVWGDYKGSRAGFLGAIFGRPVKIGLTSRNKR